MGTARGWEQPGQRALAGGGNDSEPPHPTLGAHRAPRPPTSGPARGRASARQPQPHGVSWTREEPSPPRTAAPRAALGEPTTPQAAPALSMAALCPGCDGADDEGGLGHPAGPPRSVFPPGKHSGFRWAAAAFASLGGDRGDPLGTGDPQGGGCAAIAPWCRPRLAPGPAAVTSSGCWWGPSLSPGTGTATATAPPPPRTRVCRGTGPPRQGTPPAPGGCGVPGLGAEPRDTGAPCPSPADPGGAQASPGPVPGPVPAWPWAGAAIARPAAGRPRLPPAGARGGPAAWGPPGRAGRAGGSPLPGPPAPRRPYNKVPHQLFHYLGRGRGAPPSSPSAARRGAGCQRDAPAAVPAAAARGAGAVQGGGADPGERRPCAGERWGGCPRGG